MLRTLFLLLFLVGAAPLVAQSWTSDRPDGHAPIGVMADHTHSKGEVMVSYRYMLMPMNGSLVGTDQVADEAIVAPDGLGFRVTPTEMTMQMHMLGAMYAPLDRLTLLAMVPFLVNDMDHLTRPGGSFSTGSAGLGDVSIAGLFVLAAPERQRVHLGLGLSLPTGSFEKRDDTPAGASQLPYPMQLGSGSIDFKPSLTYLGQLSTLSWGAQADATIRLHDNANDYRLGNRLAGTVWGAATFNPYFSASARVALSTWGDIRGADPAYAGGVDNQLVPTIFPTLRDGTRADVSLGLNAYLPNAAPHGLRLAAEVGLPVYQSLSGPQLETSLIGTVGVQYAF